MKGGQKRREVEVKRVGEKKRDVGGKKMLFNHPADIEKFLNV